MESVKFHKEFPKAKLLLLTPTMFLILARFMLLLKLRFDSALGHFMMFAGQIERAARFMPFSYQFY